MQDLNLRGIEAGGVAHAVLLVFRHKHGTDEVVAVVLQLVLGDGIGERHVVLHIANSRLALVVGKPQFTVMQRRHGILILIFQRIGDDEAHLSDHLSTDTHDVAVERSRRVTHLPADVAGVGEEAAQLCGLRGIVDVVLVRFLIIYLKILAHEVFLLLVQETQERTLQLDTDIAFAGGVGTHALRTVDEHQVVAVDRTPVGLLEHGVGLIPDLVHLRGIFVEVKCRRVRTEHEASLIELHIGVLRRPRSCRAHHADNCKAVGAADLLFVLVAQQHQRAVVVGIAL